MVRKELRVRCPGGWSFGPLQYASVCDMWPRSWTCLWSRPWLLRSRYSLLIGACQSLAHPVLFSQPVMTSSLLDNLYLLNLIIHSLRLPKHLSLYNHKAPEATFYKTIHTFLSSQSCLQLLLFSLLPFQFLCLSVLLKKKTFFSFCCCNLLGTYTFCELTAYVAFYLIK